MPAYLGKALFCTLAFAAAPALAAPALAVPVARDVSVMTYNVHGLPWPIASDRPVALRAIGERLRAMRVAGRQPHIVALQEAFVDDAKAIGRTAGYRYVIYGAGEDTASAAPMLPGDAGFDGADSLLTGEGIGKHVDSGLAIFSDYPILAVRRVSYPVCAGYDCLANKGAVAALIAVPGIAEPVTVVDTHLNSNGASGVDEPRALYAYRRQIDVLGRFVASFAQPGAPILVAGDFNVGWDPARRSYFARTMFGGATALAPANLQCGTMPGCRIAQPADIRLSIGRAKDWLMYRSQPGTPIRPVAIAAPFGRDARGQMLSDHIGVVVTYRFDQPDARPDPRMTLASR